MKKGVCLLILYVCLGVNIHAEDASHLLTPPPPLDKETEENYEGTTPERTTKDASDQLREEQKKQEELTKPATEQEEKEKGLDQLMKNPKFRLNIPF